MFLWGDAPANPDVPGVRLWAALNISPHAHGNPLIGPTVDTARMRLAARPGIVWYSASYQPERSRIYPTFAAPLTPGHSILTKRVSNGGPDARRIST